MQRGKNLMVGWLVLTVIIVKNQAISLPKKDPDAKEVDFTVGGS